MEKLLTPDEAGEYLGGVTKQLLATWRFESKGPRYVRLSPRMIRYTTAELDRFIAASMRQSTADVA